MIMENIAVLIPALDPNHKLADLVKKLKQIGLANIVVIDDGSGASAQAVFDEVQRYGAKVYHHKNNKGKGAALKTGFEWIKKTQPHISGVVTADADGQHAAADILRVALALDAGNTIVLGTRALFRSGVPLASKMGNLFSAIYYKLKTGRFLKDTQTGLRGIPARHFDFALNVAGERYDYEMRFLEQMNEENIDYYTVDIETIYEEDRVTHFRTVSDSYVIYQSFFKNIASSLLSAIVDISFFMLFVGLGNRIFSATAIARFLSGIFNFSLNKIWVFDKKDSHNTRNESLKYLALFITQMIVSGFLTEALSDVLNFNNSLLFIKICVDCFLFVTNFFVQRFWIFPSNKNRPRKMKTKHTFARFYTAILVVVTVWSLLSTFVIADEVAVVDETMANTSIYTDLENETSSSSSSDSDLVAVSSGSTAEIVLDEESSSSESDSVIVSEVDSSNADPIITDTSYQDANIQITIDTIRAYNTDIYIADVVVSDIAYLKTALANNTYGRNIKETTSEMAAEHDAILAINGDYYGFRNAGFVLRNGVLYQTTARSATSEALVVNADGSFEIVAEGSSDAQELYEEGALQIFTFGPGLIEDGEISVTSGSEVSQSKSSNPRTAIGMVAENHYIFVVSDGRTSQSEGLSLLELAEIMQSYGCTVAYNLDGGGSSTMVFNGQVINNPTSGRSIGERRVSDIIYIGENL